MESSPNINPKILPSYFSKEDTMTLSEKIEAKLTQHATATGKSFSIENRGRPTEIFKFGNESARLVRRLNNGTVGEEGGIIRNYVEWDEYKRYEWWKYALEGLPVNFLETRIETIFKNGAQGTEIPFSPTQVVKEFRLNPKNDLERQIACEQWVVNHVIQVLDPLLKPNYKVIFQESHFRLMPLTEDAVASRLTDNAAYNQAQNNILKTVELLRQNYEAMSKKLNG